MLIALDANIWISESLLRSATGAAFLHALRRMNAKVFLPDTTRDEIIVGIGRIGSETTEKVQKSLSKIRSLIGFSYDCRLPSSDEFCRAVKDRLHELSSLLSQIEVTFDQYKKALLRLNKHKPPAEKSEQFRDCLLWESILDNMTDQNILVTADQDFYDNRDLKNGLAKVLRKESKDKVCLYNSLEDCLESIVSQAPPIDEKLYLGIISKEAREEANTLARDRGFIIGEQKEAEVKFFATEEPGATAIVFKISFLVYDLTLHDGSVVKKAVISLTGDCILDSGDHIRDFSMKRICAYSTSGDSLPFQISYGGGTLTLGVRQVPYEVRAEL